MTATIDQEEMLGVLLAYSDTWQELLGATTPDEALLKQRSYQAADDGDEAVPYPRAVIVEVEFERVNKATRTFAGRGALMIAFEVQPPDAELETIEQQRKWVLSLFKAIDLDMRTVSSSRATPTGYTVSHFQIKNTSWAEDPHLVPEAEREEQSLNDTTPAKNVWAFAMRVEY